MPWQLDRLLELAKGSVLDPDIVSAFYLLIVSFLNELTSIVPLGSILSGQILLADGEFTMALAIKMFIFVAVPVGIGVAFGSMLIYAIAYWGGKKAIDNYGKYIGLRWEKIKEMEDRLKKSRFDELLFFTFRSIPFFPNVPLTAAAGVIRMKISSFLILTTLGTILRMVIMMGIAALGGFGLF